MIIQLILHILVSAVNVIFSWLPEVTELPWGIDAILLSGVSQVKAVAVYIPPLTTVLGAFMIYVGFRLTLIVLKLFLGHRTPMHH